MKYIVDVPFTRREVVTQYGCVRHTIHAGSEEEAIELTKKLISDVDIDPDMGDLRDTNSLYTISDSISVEEGKQEVEEIHESKLHWDQIFCQEDPWAKYSNKL